MDQKLSSFSIFDLFDIDTLLQKFNEFKEKLAQKFKKPVQPVPESVPEVRNDCKPGDEMTQELTDAWNLFTRVSEGLLSGTLIHK